MAPDGVGLCWVMPASDERCRPVLKVVRVKDLDMVYC